MFIIVGVYSARNSVPGEGALDIYHRFRLVLAVLLLLLAPAARAEEALFFQLGTGPSGSSRFPLGGLIANALSNPPGSRPCDQGGSCGPPGLVAVARSSSGSAENLRSLASGRIDAALVDAQIALAAVRGEGDFHGRPFTELRGIAMLYSESLHLVVRKGLGIAGIRDLAGRRVGLDPAAAAAAPLLLAAWGVRPGRLKLIVEPPPAAAADLAVGKLDAAILLGAWPIAAIADPAGQGKTMVLPLAGPEADRLRQRFPVFTRSEIGAGAYPGTDAPLPTLDIGIALVTTAKAPTALVAAIAHALRQPPTQALLRDGDSHGERVLPDADALTRLGIPLHPGAIP